MRSIFRVVFYLRSNYLNKEGKTSVMIRIYLNNDRTSLGSSGVFIAPELWDSKNGKVKGRTSEALQLNLQLENIKGHIKSLYQKLEFDEGLSLELIKSKYLGKSEEMGSILDLFNAYIANQYKVIGVSIAPASILKYDVCKRHLIRFMQENYKRKDLLLKELSCMVVMEFDLFLRSTIRQNAITANRTMRTLRTIILFGRKLGLIQSDPFIGYKPQPVVQNRGFLTEEELIRILGKTFAMERLNLIRDVFIFSCFTGLAYVDIVMPKHGNIVSMNDKKWIMTHRKKRILRQISFFLISLSN